MRARHYFIPDVLPLLVGLMVGVSPAWAAGPPQPAGGVEAAAIPALIESDGRPYQLIQFRIEHTGPPADAVVRATGAKPLRAELVPGEQTIDLPIPADDSERTIRVSLRSKGRGIFTGDVVVPPSRRWTVYILPHSHVDIGYTRLQTEVEAQQHAHLEQAVQLAAQTDGYPEGSRFKWNSEVLWAVDSYLARAPDDRRKAFIDFVKGGAIELNALYGNELTALCRAEELVRLVERAVDLRREHGVPVDTAMISDVPGYTWGLVPVLAGSDIRYFSIGPNRSDRIGFTLQDWGDRPFYWTGPSGDTRVLCWMAGEGYSLFHRGPLRDGKILLDYLARLEKANHPYDMLQVRYSIGGDNGPPDPGLPEFVRDWNAKYVSPRLVIATASEMFHAFEAKYGDVLPVYSGDFTPYWEDGAASSARETGLNRAAAERLTQAEVLWTLLDPERYPAREFNHAWRNVLLYNEHTWGAHNSISKPDDEFAKGQWRIKQAFAYDAHAQSLDLLDRSLARIRREESPAHAVMVFNTCSWPRTDLVRVPAPLQPIGTRVTDAAGNDVPSQVLSTGELAFLASDVPPMGAKRFLFRRGTHKRGGSARAGGSELENETLRIRVDLTTGAVSSLTVPWHDDDLVDSNDGLGLNEYLYVPGKDPKDVKRVADVTVRVGEAGPLVASLVVESEAPGCFSLTRELRVTHGIDRLDIIDVINKIPVRRKEGVHIAFPFRVPDGVVRIDTPWAVVRPEVDQLPGSCKNWFTVQRWADVSNAELGITWATVDAPLVELGSITAELPWIRTLAPTQTLFSYVMNNYWHTNYKADQDGPTLFRYAIRPHKAFDEGAAHRFGIGSSQPFIVVPVSVDEPEHEPLLRIGRADVLVSALRPDNDGEAWTLRLFGATGRPQSTGLDWRGSNQPTTWLSDLTGVKRAPMHGSVNVPTHGVVTLRVQPVRAQ